MAKKNYKIRAKFVFDGHAVVRASSRQEAEASVMQHLSANLGKIEAQDECIVDLDFSAKGCAVVNRKREEDGV